MMMNCTTAFLGRVGGKQGISHIKQCIYHADCATFNNVEEVVNLNKNIHLFILMDLHMILLHTVLCTK